MAALPELDQPGTLVGSHGFLASTSQLKPAKTPGVVDRVRSAPDPIMVLCPTITAPAAPESFHRQMVVGCYDGFGWGDLGEPGHVDMAFDRHRDAVQGPERIAGDDGSLGPLSLLAGTGCIDVEEGVQGGVMLLDPTEEVVRHLDRRDPPLGDQLTNLPSG